MNLRALLLTRVFPPMVGGSGRWFWELYRRMPREDVLVVAGEHPQAHQFDAAHELDVRRVPLEFPSWGALGPRRLANYAALVRTLRRLVKRERIGAIHCACCLPEGLAGLVVKRLSRIKLAVYVHGEELNVASTSRELTWLTRRVLRGADQVLANSQNTARLLSRGWTRPNQQVHVMHPGVDVERFRPAARDDGLRTRLGWQGRRVVLTVGRLQKRKGHDRMIEALPAIRSRVPDVLYAIAGDGDERRRLEELAASTGVADLVQFMGELENDALVRAYQQCDLFALPNREVDGDIEGFGMVLVEAQACGKPVIAGDSGGTRETMRVPQTGRIVDCREPGPLAEQVTALLVDEALRRQMGETARAWAAAEFDWSGLAEAARTYFQISGLMRAGGRPTKAAPVEGVVVTQVENMHARRAPAGHS